MYTSLPLTPLFDSVKHYTELFNTPLLEKNLDKNFISSPLGAWILLALVSNNAEEINDDLTYDLEKVLGMTTTEAFKTVGLLLATAPEVISASVGSWINAELANKPAFIKWLKSVSGVMTVDSKIPEQKVLDEWAEEKTLGLIKKFPMIVDRLTVFLLATVLATKISWVDEFEVIENELMPEWGTKKILKSPTEHQKWVEGTDKGTFGVHTARSNTTQGQLTVFSVIGDPALSAAEVLNEAQNIVANYINHKNSKVSLFDIPLEGNSFISIAEEEITQYNSMPTEIINSYLPAWKAESRHELRDIDGFNEAFALFGDTGDLDMEVIQVAVASYDKKGFEAAAITSMMFGAAGLPRLEDVLVREAKLKFNHPYAVVALFHDQRRYDENKEVPNYALWNGLPAFTAWVREALEPTED